MSRSALGLITFLAISSVARAGSTPAVAIDALHDALVRELDPASNFGGAGLLCVAGSASVNGDGQPRGRYDSVMKFNVSSALAAFDADFGPGNWTLASIDLQVYQMAAPENAFFPRGDGDFEIAWISDDSWAEGTGTPNSPQTPLGNEITWSSLQTLLASATRRPLGLFHATQQTQIIACNLALDSTFTADLLATGLVSLHLAPTSSALGLTFHSRNFSDPTRRPQLILTPAPFLRGDMNCDNVIDSLDVAPFVLALIDSNAYHNAFPQCDILRADTNGDHLIDGSDIPLFIAELLAP